jgi:hypothetical protein
MTERPNYRARSPGHLPYEGPGPLFLPVPLDLLQVPWACLNRAGLEYLPNLLSVFAHLHVITWISETSDVVLGNERRNVALRQ